MVFIKKLSWTQFILKLQNSARCCISSDRNKASEAQAGCGSGEAVHMAHAASHKEQVGQQLGKDRQVRRRRQWTQVLLKEDGTRFLSLKSKVKQ